MKRMFEEKSTSERKATKTKETKESRLKLSDEAKDNKKIYFDLLVRVSCAKQKMQTVVKADKSVAFERELTNTMQQGMFKQIMEKLKKQKKKKGPAE